MNALLLNSVHGKYPVCSEGWIQATLRAMQHLSSQSAEIICSTEPVTWDIATYLAGISGMRIRFIVKAGNIQNGQNEFSASLEDFALDPQKVTPLFLPEEEKLLLSHPRDSWPKRDRLALQSADIVYPIAIRPGGRLENMMNETPYRRKICDNFRIAWTPAGFIPRYSLTGRPWNPLPNGEWLVHWTRTCPGKWPGEKSCDFYHDLLNNTAVYVRNAGETLSRIIREQKIRGSDWKTPGNVPLTAFTALDPGDALALMCWRKRYGRYSFEPFGIGVRKEALLALGARRVNYTYEGETPDCDRAFTHAAGDQGHWVWEKEWRVLGDVSLNAIDRKDCIAIVPERFAADTLKRKIPADFPVHILFE
ncbi:MAG: hypothetical protein WCU00_02010 [Candidatus Latescibacterota bacterium]